MKVLMKILFIFLTVVAVYTSFSQNIQLDDFVGEDKLAHAGFYFFMTILGIYAFRWYAVLWVAGLSSILELIQKYVPTRDANIFDLLSNMLGIGMASLIVGLIHFRKRRRMRESLSARGEAKDGIIEKVEDPFKFHT